MSLGNRIPTFSRSGSISASYIPTVTNTYDLGSSSKTFKSAYLSNSLVLSNNAIIKARNFANSADIEVLKLSTSNVLTIKTPLDIEFYESVGNANVAALQFRDSSGKFVLYGATPVLQAQNDLNIIIDGDGNRRFVLGAGSDTTLTMKYGDGATAGQTLTISNNGLNDGYIAIAGGQSYGTSNGGNIEIAGISHANTGTVNIYAGNSSTGHVRATLTNTSSQFQVHTGSSVVASITRTGLITAAAGVTISSSHLTLTSGSIVMNAANSTLVPGNTTFAIRNNANTLSNFSITDAGVATIRAGLQVTAGGATISAGNITIGNGTIDFVGTSRINGSSGANLILAATNGAVDIHTHSSSPVARWRFDVSGNLEQNITNGGDFVMSKSTTKLLIGQTGIPGDVSAFSGVQSPLNVYKSNPNSHDLVNFQVGGNVAQGVKINGLKSRSTDGSADVAVQAGDALLGMYAYGADGTTFRTGGYFLFDVGTTPGPSDMPTNFRIFLSPDGTASPAEVVRFGFDKSTRLQGTLSFGASSRIDSHSGGNLTLAANNGGVDILTGATPASRWFFDTSGNILQNINDGGNIVFQNDSTTIAFYTVDNISAAGTVQADATALTGTINYITSAAALSGVRLWDAPVGSVIHVTNAGANTLSVYPPVGHTISGKAVNVHVSVVTTSGIYCIKRSSTNWWCGIVTRAS